MSSPVELFQAGRLKDAVALATERVRDDPTNVTARSQLSELLCFTGDLERADKQLDAAAQIDPEVMVGTSLLRHLIRSEVTRREVFEQGRVPEFLSEPGESAQKRLKALLALREGAAAEAAQLVAEAASEEPLVRVTIDEGVQSGFRDLDDVLGPILEVYTATGKYYWVPVHLVRRIEMSPIETLADMLWRSAQIETVGDVNGRVHLPAIYYGSQQSADERVWMGRATEWEEASPGGCVRGRGQKEYLVGDDAMPVLSLGTFTIEV